MATIWGTATAVRRAGSGVYEASLDQAWWAVNGPHGGYLAAIVLRAMATEVDDPARAARTFTVYFLSRAEPGPLSIEATVLRAGTSMTTMSAWARQGDRTIATALASFSASRQNVAPIEDAVMPKAIPLEDAFVLPTEGPGLPEFLRHMANRAAVGPRPFSGANEGLLGSWLRMAEPQPVDAPMVAMYADAVAPAIWPRLTMPVATITVDLTVHFRHALPANDVADGAFHLGVFRTRVSRDGFAEEDGEIWDPAGRLVAQTRQLQILREFKMPDLAPDKNIR